MINEYNEFISQINQSTSSNNKVQLISESTPFVQKVLYYTYNPFYNYGVSSKNLMKRSDIVTENTYDIFSLLDDLRHRKITGHTAIGMCNGFAKTNPEFCDMLHKVIDKDLKIRSGVKLINKGIKNLIPEFSVALADTYNDKTVKKISFDKQWFVSRKLDGVRCLTIIDEEGNIQFFSRAGKEFTTLDKIKEEILLLGLKSTVLDGEICRFSKDKSTEDFQGIIKEIRRKDHVITDATYCLFDMISLEDFNKKVSSTTFSDRLLKLKGVLASIETSYIELLEQHSVESLNDLNMFVNNYKKDPAKTNWEGLIARKDAKYQGKRSRDILKIKTFFDAEYTVKSVIFGPFRFVKDNVEVEEEMLSAVVIEHKDNIVQVGSGLTIEQRQYFHKYPEEILGKVITVQYFEETRNQDGEYSLRFPVIKTIYDEERNM